MRVAILASGPSMGLDVVGMVRRARSGLYVIAVNDTYRLMPDADALFAADVEWWQAHPEALAFKGAKFVNRDQRVEGAIYIPPQGSKAGGNSALRAAEMVAGWPSVDRVLLFGVDLRDDQVTHWFGQHPSPLFNATEQTFRRARARWAEFAARADRPEVLNCNPASGLACFERVDPAVALGLEEVDA